MFQFGIYPNRHYITGTTFFQECRHYYDGFNTGSWISQAIIQQIFFFLMWKQYKSYPFGKRYTWGLTYWKARCWWILFLVYQYCLKMWSLRSLEGAGVIQKHTNTGTQKLCSIVHIPGCGWGLPSSTCFLQFAFRSVTSAVHQFAMRYL